MTARRIVTAHPENSETPLERTRGWVTPSDSFFVRNHSMVPALDSATWRLRVGGRVTRELELDLASLDGGPQRSVFATLECAGNGRSFLAPPSPGVQWGAGAVGHAEWSGVPLAWLLHEAGLEPSALEVVGAGADRGSDSSDGGAIQFARSLPLDKALHPDTLVALHMNGAPLAPEHGWPARLLVPGWYGVASVKWLTRLEVVDRRFDGYFQTAKYSVRRGGGRGVERVPVGPMAVKSEILAPHEGETLAPGRNRVFGLAWAGEDEVARVEVSFDAGVTWRRASLTGPSAPYSWVMWECAWEVEETGEHSLLARAVSRGGRVQRAEHDPLCEGYRISWSRAVTVQIDASLPRRRSYGPALPEAVRARTEERGRLPLDVGLEFAGGEGI